MKTTYVNEVCVDCQSNPSVTCYETALTFNEAGGLVKRECQECGEEY